MSSRNDRTKLFFYVFNINVFFKYRHENLFSERIILQKRIFSKFIQVLQSFTIIIYTIHCLQVPHSRKCYQMQTAALKSLFQSPYTYILTWKKGEPTINIHK